MVVAGEEQVALEGLQGVVERLDRLQIQVVGRCVEDDAIGIDQHHAGDHTTHLLAS